MVRTMPGGLFVLLCQTQRRLKHGVKGGLLNTIEIKIKLESSQHAKEIFKKLNAEFQRTEDQVDTYFAVENGRLKLREVKGKGSQLIQYFRDAEYTPKRCNYAVVRVNDADKFGQMLEHIHGVYAVVTKKREYWQWNEIQIHMDAVQDLGIYVEFEATTGNFKKHIDAEDKFIFLMSQLNVRSDQVLHIDYAQLMHDKKRVS